MQWLGYQAGYQWHVLQGHAVWTKWQAQRVFAADGKLRMAFRYQSMQWFQTYRTFIRAVQPVMVDFEIDMDL